jgi:GGDEF domain-containing protein
MAIFASFARRRTSSDQATAAELPESIRRQLPMRLEALGDALASGVDTTAACSVVGRAIAQDGASLGEALDGLRATFALVSGGHPDFSSTEALSVAWSEASLQYLHQLSCEDPLTGLASLAHVRTRLAEIYRDAEQAGVRAQETHGLVVVELHDPAPVSTGEQKLTRAFRLVELTETMRTVFSGGETIGRLGLDRAVAVVRRGPGLGRSVTTLRGFVSDLDLASAQARVWIEGLPGNNDGAASLLDELAR